MNRRGAGISLIAVAAFLNGVRYLSAAIFGSGVSSWSSDLFAHMVSYIGPQLSAWSWVALVVGIIYLIWSEVTEKRRDSE